MYKHNSKHHQHHIANSVLTTLSRLEDFLGSEGAGPQGVESQGAGSYAVGRGRMVRRSRLLVRVRLSVTEEKRLRRDRRDNLSLLPNLQETDQNQSITNR